MYQLSHYWSPRRTKEKGSEQLFEEIIPQNSKSITIEKNLEKGFEYRKITIEE